MNQQPRSGSVKAAKPAVTRSRTRRFELNTPPDLWAPGRARQAVAAACRHWHLEHLLPAAQLIASELVTNAVRHARTDIHLEVALRGALLHLRVHDRNPMPPRMDRIPNQGQLDVGGRGLNLVEACSAGWGYVLGPTGKVVWATLRDNRA